MPIDINTFPISGRLLMTILLWGGVSAFALGPLVADRTIERSHWGAMCERALRADIATQTPKAETSPTITCDAFAESMDDAFDTDTTELCDLGGNIFLQLLTLDPLAGQKEQARQRTLNRLAKTAAQAPSRCSCASSVVASDRMEWGLYAGSARLIGGPQNLQSDLTQALYSSACTMKMEG